MNNPQRNYHQIEQLKKNLKSEDVPTQYGLGVRHTQVLIVFLSLLVGFATKAHLGVTIVAMTAGADAGAPARDLHNTSSVDKKINGSADIGNTSIVNGNHTISFDENLKHDIYRTYNWTKAVQEMILTSFLLGYAVMMFPMGIISQRVGGKVPLQVSLLVCGLSSLPVPWLCHWGGWEALCVCRTLQGMAQAGLTPAAHNILGQWVPVTERGRLTTLVYTGTTFGIVLGFQVSGALSNSRAGWPSVYWIIGLINLVTLAVVSCFIVSSPSRHKHITSAEKNFILGRLDRGTKRKRKLPWKALLTSKHVWAVVGSHAATGVSNVFCSLQVPSYLHHVLRVNVKSSGMLASLPYVATSFASIGYGALSDYLTNNGILTLRTARIVFNTIGESGIAVCLALVTFTTDTSLAVACFILSLTTFAAVHSGGYLSYIDMAPNYSGALVALGSTFMYSLLLLVPVMVSSIVTDMTNQLQWRTMFLIISGFGLTGTLTFIMFMTADIQPWNYYGENEVNEEEEVHLKQTDISIQRH